MNNTRNELVNIHAVSPVLNVGYCVGDSVGLVVDMMNRIK